MGIHISNSTLFTRLRDSLGLERNVLVMITAGIIQSFGIALWSSYLPKLLEVLGARGLMIGAFGTIGALLWIVFPYLGGVLSDRLGRGQAMILASSLAAAGHLVYMLAPRWWMFLPGLVLITASGSFGFMGSLALVGDALQSRRRATSMAVRGIVGALPAIFGPPIGGALIVWVGMIYGVRMGLLVTVMLTLAAIWLQRRYYQTPSGDSQVSWDVWSAWRAIRPDLKRLLVADCLVRFGSGMANLFIVLYAMDVLRSSALEFGFLKSLETLTSVIFLVPVSKLSDRAGPKSRWPFVAATYFLFAAFPLALALAPSARWLPMVFVIAGLRHTGEPARKALIVDLAEGSNRGSVIGVYYSVLGAVVFPASFLGGWLWEWLPTAPFIAGASVTGLGLAWFLWRGPKRSLH